MKLQDYSTSQKMNLLRPWKWEISSDSFINKMKKKQPMQGGFEKKKQKYEKKSRPLKDDNAPKLITIDIENY